MPLLALAPEIYFHFILPEPVTMNKVSVSELLINL